MRIAIVFPGQGTQAPGMGIPWKGHPSWIAVEASLDPNAVSLGGLLFDASAEDLTSTRDAQLSVLLNSLICWDAVQPRLDAGAHEIVGFAGHSLGQVTALIATGSIALDDGVRFAEFRATVTQREATKHPGRMAALIGASIEQAEAACAGETDVWIANDNAPGQIVIAGTPEGIEKAIERGKSIGIRKALPLAVEGAFHTPLMQGAVDPLAEALAETPILDSKYGVVSNADAAPYWDGSGWRDRLALHPTQRVLWRSSMETLTRDLHADAMLEIGHGTMIAGLARRAVPGTAVFGISSPDTADEALAALDAIANQAKKAQHD